MDNFNGELYDRYRGSDRAREFNAEMGEMRSAAELKRLREREVENVVVDMNNAPSTRHEAIALIPEGGKVFHNTDQDVDIRVGKKTIRHSLLHPSDDAIKAIGSINMIVANAVKIGELPVATNETGHTRSVSVYYTPIDIEGRHFSARLVIKELENNSKVLDELLLYNMAMHKKKNTIDLNVNASQSEVGVNPDNVSGYKVKDLIHSTQEADKKLLGITTGTGGVQTRTPEFKQWFGDWEAVKRVKAIDNLIAIDPTKFMMNGTPEETFMSLGAATNILDHTEVKFDHDAFKKNYKEGGKFEAIIPALKDIFERSVLLSS